MPIGVPKVPYRIPGDEEATWVDLYNVMYRERTLFLGQEIRCEITNHITGLMVYLSIEDGNSDIFLFINSPGGWLISGMANYIIKKGNVIKHQYNKILKKKERIRNRNFTFETTNIFVLPPMQ